jgi:hypothetical protein
MANMGEVLFASDSTGGITAWDPRAGTVLQSYRGSGGEAKPRVLGLLVNGKFMMAADSEKSFVWTWPLHTKKEVCT